MGRNSPIEWTHHTFNPWWGCTKISPSCKYCYAERWSKRTGSKLWGATSGRRFFGERHWHEPIVWNRLAEKHHKRRRVFCASMADVFEDRPDLIQWRRRLWQLIENTPWLDWLLLTKRVENLKEMIPWQSIWPHNVWLGTTVENQKMAQKRIPILLQYPAIVRFVSCEPLLGPVELKQWLIHSDEKGTGNRTSATIYAGTNGTRINWVIAGGESGHYARPTNPSWVRDIRDQCMASNTPFHFKQWGCWRPLEKGAKPISKTTCFEDTNGKSVTLLRMGKKAAGRELDGRTWSEMPIYEFDKGR
ncbi:MAG: hypothetical protein A2169_05080 [Deltaproteobacteria bacterium RBG_13_47_9]|nr:MAG: hypothetical protein A2169_05080 [Deltaproteobacteria bacterium RBG_13_47_9]